MRLIKAILFDLDDTLWPIVPTILRAEAELFRWLQHHAPAVASRHTIDSLRERRKAMMAQEPRFEFDLRALRSAGLTQAFAECGEDPAKVDEAMEIFNRERNAVQLYDDVRPCLARLAKRAKLGSVTNGVADLRAIGLADFFSASIAAHQLGCGKPDPAIFLAGCAALGVAPDEAAYIGDDPALDVEGAQKAGLAGIWLNRAGAEPSRILPDHIHPDAIVVGLDELESWLDRQESTARSAGLGSSKRSSVE
jgi:HAD superfamily hydrolase (TIGR01509 family)